MLNGGKRSIGTYNWDPVVELEYPAAFQEALPKVLDGKKTFRYIYLGGAFTEPDQEKNLWFFAKGRRVRVGFLGGFVSLQRLFCMFMLLVNMLTYSQGLAQAKFLEFGKQKQKQNVETYVVKPAVVLAKDASALLGSLFRIFSVPAVRVDQLAAVMVDLAVNGGSEQLVSNRVIIESGRELLMKQKG